ncbi:MAG: hypothetical protein IKE64_10715, partial [Thermoguttaceae bacterium]|nr:hypothetical protein [Thermoguttaceae bacterium]
IKKLNKNEKNLLDYMSFISDSCLVTDTDCSISLDIGIRMIDTDDKDAIKVRDSNDQNAIPYNVKLSDDEVYKVYKYEGVVRFFTECKKHIPEIKDNVRPTNIFRSLLKEIKSDARYCFLRTISKAKNQKAALFSDAAVDEMVTLYSKYRTEGCNDK